MSAEQLFTEEERLMLLHIHENGSWVRSLNTLLIRDPVAVVMSLEMRKLVRLSHYNDKRLAFAQLTDAGTEAAERMANGRIADALKETRQNIRRLLRGVA